MRVLALTLLLLAAAGAPASAQRALVLSGGAARGLAHVGVIRYLDEIGYDADLVVGNSMGAVVGALYAAGYQPDEIRRRVQEVRWSEMFEATPLVLGPERLVRSPALTLDLNVGRFRASRGLFGQWRVNRALASLLFDANARSRGDFDKLPRRFRAIAADLATGEAVVLDTGDVALAVRASMAFPGFFGSVDWGGRVLVDGGIVDNFPTATARALAADYVVGVDVTKPPPEITTQAPLSVIDRSLNLMLQNLQRSNPRPDALVTPIVAANFVGPSFPDDPAPLMQLGYDAARRDLDSISLPLGARAERDLPAAPRSFSALIIQSPDSALARIARVAFGDLIGRPYEPRSVLAAMDRLYSTGLFEAVWPRAVEADDPREPALLVKLHAPPRVSLSAAAHFENDRGGRAWASVDKNGSLLRLPTVASVAAAAGSLERWALASLKLYAPSDRAIALSAGAHVLERGTRHFADDAVRVQEMLRIGAFAGLEFPHILKERVVTALARVESIDREDAPGGSSYGPLVRFANVGPEVRPVGLPFIVEAERRWGDVSYSRTVLSGSLIAGKVGPQFALAADLRTVSAGAPEDVMPALGDQHAIPGLRWGEFRGRARVVTGVDVAVPIRTSFARLRVRSGGVAASLTDIESSRWIAGAQLGMVWKSPLGMLEAGYGIATRGDGRFDVSIGRDF